MDGGVEISATRYEYYITGADSFKAAYGSQWQTQTFTPQANHTITHLALRMKRRLTPGATTVEIQATTAGKPNGTVLATGSIPEASLYLPLTGYDILTWPGVIVALAASLDVIDSITLAIVLYNSGNAFNTADWIADFGGSYSLGANYSSLNSGALWTLQGYDCLFEEWNGEPSPATVTTQSPTSLTEAGGGTTFTATGNGNITGLGDSAYVYQHGHVWSTSINPTISDFPNGKTNGVASGTGTFTSFMSGLLLNTLYHCRAFAVGMAGVVYGEDVAFRFSGGEGQGLFAVVGETVHYVSKLGIEYVLQGTLAGGSGSGGESKGVIGVVGDTFHYLSKTGLEYVLQGSVAGVGDGTAGESLGSSGVVGETLHYVGKSGVEYILQGTGV